jgi:SAM-dependent methyltransferase
VVVSFETIEHVTNPSTFLDECRRVCAPDGTLIISTPNKEVYGDRNNPFHCSEMTFAEFSGAISERFSRVEFFTQRQTRANWYSPLCIAADYSPWNRLRGFGRLQKVMRSMICPKIVELRGEKDRVASTLEAIHSNERALASLVNPYLVKGPVDIIVGSPLYLIAVARIASANRNDA